MANSKSYYTSADVVEAVQRKIAMPLSQQTFLDSDVLKFANEELMISAVPSIMVYNQEYFVQAVQVPLQENTSRYEIPDRAIGIRFRDIFYQDTEGNLFEMARVNADDKAFYQRNVGANSSIHKFYIEGNSVVLEPDIVGIPQGNLMFYIYLRPNQLVDIARAATLISVVTPPSQLFLNLQSNSTFINLSTNVITIPLHGLVDGNKITIRSTDKIPSGLSSDLYYVVNSTINTFQLSLSIGGTPQALIDYGTGLLTIVRRIDLINGLTPDLIDFTTGTFTIINNDLANDQKIEIYNLGGVLPTPLAVNTFYYVINRTINTIQLALTLGGLPINITYSGTGTQYITADISVLTFDNVPVNITNGSLVDFLQTKKGHKTYAYDVMVPTNGVSGNTVSFLTSQLPIAGGIIRQAPFLQFPNIDCDDLNLINFDTHDQNIAVMIPTSFLPGDYICSANECIIPQIPDDLHSGLAERTSARILAAQGDMSGLQATQGKLADIVKQEGILLDNRSEGNGMKIVNRHSLLRYGRFFGRRRV